jgi:hypothetical protein
MVRQGGKKISGKNVLPGGLILRDGGVTHTKTDGPSTLGDHNLQEIIGVMAA